MAVSAAVMNACSRLDLRRMQILVVDDNSASRQVLSQILMGLRARSSQMVDSAREAREQLALRRYDLLVIDLEMPDEDGVSLTRFVRRTFDQPNYATPIIILSGAPSREKMLAARDAGANAVIRKPLAPAALAERIQWLASAAREFVRSESFCGPDRRFKNEPPPEGGDRRATATVIIEDAPREAEGSNGG
jgi:CheY-like chemotaxis protein